MCLFTFDPSPTSYLLTALPTFVHRSQVARGLPQAATRDGGGGGEIIGSGGNRGGGRL